MRSIMSVGAVLCGLFLVVYLYALPIAYAIPDDGNRGYSQSSYGRADRDQQGGYSQGSYYTQGSYNTGNNPGNPNAPGYNDIPSSGNSSNNSNDNDDDDDDDNNSSSNYLPPVVRSVASLIWSAGAKTVDTASRVFAAAQAVVTRSTARDTYTSLPSYLSTGANPDTAGRSPAVPTPPTTFFDTPVSNLPISPALRAQIDAIEKQQTKTGVLTEALTPTQKAILERARIELGANISNPAVESAILLATRGQSVADAIALLQEVERVTGGTINGAAVDIAFGRSCGDADCRAAEQLRTLAGVGGIGGSVRAQEELERQMQGVDERRKGSFAPATPAPVRQQTAEERAAEVTRMIEINEVGGEGSAGKIVDAQNAVAQAQRDLEAAERALVGDAQNDLIDQQVADLRARVTDAQNNLNTAITRRNAGDIVGSLEASNATINTSRNISTQSEIYTNRYGDTQGQQLGTTYSGPRGTPTGLSVEARQANVRVQGFDVPSVSATEAEIELMTRMILAETDSIRNLDGSINMQGVQGVAEVMRNRVLSPSFPNNVTDVVLQPYQFSPSITSAQNLPQYGPGSADYAAAELIARAVLAGEVAPIAVTETGGGMTHYQNDKTVFGPNSPSSQRTQNSVAKMWESLSTFNIVDASRTFFQHTFGVRDDAVTPDLTRGNAVAISTEALPNGSTVRETSVQIESNGAITVAQPRTFTTSEPSAINAARNTPLGRTSEPPPAGAGGLLPSFRARVPVALHPLSLDTVHSQESAFH